MISLSEYLQHGVFEAKIDSNVKKEIKSWIKMGIDYYSGRVGVDNEGYITPSEKSAYFEIRKCLPDYIPGFTTIKNPTINIGWQIGEEIDRNTFEKVVSAIDFSEVGRLRIRRTTKDVDFSKLKEYSKEIEDVDLSIDGRNHPSIELDFDINHLNIEWGSDLKLKKVGSLIFNPSGNKITLSADSIDDLDYRIGTRSSGATHDLSKVKHVGKMSISGTLMSTKPFQDWENVKLPSKIDTLRIHLDKVMVEKFDWKFENEVELISQIKKIKVGKLIVNDEEFDQSAL